MKYVVDTNVFLSDLDKILGRDDLVITSHVIRELENHKKKKELQFAARAATRFIESKADMFTFDMYDYSGIIGEGHDPNYVDNKIIDCCKTNGYGLVTNDLLLKQKARGFGIELIALEDSIDYDFTGVSDILVNTDSPEGQEILAAIYSAPEENHFGMRENEYVALWDATKPLFDIEDGKLLGYNSIDKFKWVNGKLQKLKFRSVNSKYLGKIKPVNIKQEFLFDMLQNDSITVKSCFGKFGVGKDFVMISHAIEALETNKFEKIIWARNNIELKDSQPIGFLPGDADEKLISWALPLADHLGGIDGLRLMMDRGRIEIQHLGNLRGRDIKNSIIYVTEVQNNTREHVQLLLGRVGQGSQIWLNGDMKQVDKDTFAYNSGLKALTRLAGNPLYGQVTLDKTERSETASLAELI